MEKYSASLVFLDEEKRKEWERLDPSIKNNIFAMLHTASKKMEIGLCIEMLCNVIIDMDKRLKKLERNSIEDCEPK